MNREFDSYIRGIDFDKKDLLTVPCEQSEVKPDSAVEGDGKFGIMITHEEHKFDEGNSSISTISALEEFTYPGSTLLINRNLASGQPQPLLIPRSPKTRFTISAPVSKNFEVDNLTYGNYITKLSEVIRNSDIQATPARIKFTVDQSSSLEETSCKLKTNINVLKALDTNNVFTFDSSEEKESYIVNFEQVYYTVSMDLPYNPSDLFTDDIDMTLVKDVVDSQNPAGYVKNVQYGRKFFVKIESSLKKNSWSTENNLKLIKKSFEADVSLTAEEKSQISNYSYTLIGIGGNAKSFSNLIGEEGLETIKSYIQEGANFTLDNPGVPISYTTCFLKDSSIANFYTSGNYWSTEYKKCINREIILEHVGAYVAEFRLFYDRYELVDGKWQLLKNQFYKSGNRTSGFKSSVPYLDWKCTNFRVDVGVCTGLAWDQWNTLENTQRVTYNFWKGALNRILDSKEKAHIAIWGTTLGTVTNISYE